MDDVSFKVRQIAQYPAATFLNPEDVFLVQQGGLTGLYKSATRDLIVNGALGMSAGLLPPLPHVGMTASFSTVQNGPSSGFNWFLDQSNTVRYMQAGVAGRWDFGEGSLNFSIAPQGLAGSQIYEPWWLRLFDLDYSGNLTVYQQVRCGRPPGRCEEVVTLGYLQACAVTSFDGRFGDICLNAADVNAALAVVPGDSVVTRFWVDDTISRALDQFYFCRQLVRSFDGRTGNVILLATDVSQALFADPPNSAAPTPPAGDSSNLIATTAFVSTAITNLENTIEADLSAYALLDSPAFTGIPTAPTAAFGTATSQIATTAFVDNAIAESTTGVSSFNSRTGSVILTQQDIINAAGWDSAALTGTPTAPTPPPGDISTRIATTAFVASIAARGVTSFNTRTGAITLVSADLSAAGGALLDSPAFTGVPSAPTATPGTSTTQLATTAFVTAAISAGTAGVASFNGRTGAVALQANDLSAVGGALLTGPAFTGVPSAPTAAPGTSTTQIATTAFVMAQLASTGVNSFNTRTGSVTLQLADVTAVGGAPLAGPTFTGIPAAPTAAPGTSTTQLATTAFVTAAIAAIPPPGGVTSFNTRTGAITLVTADITGAGGAPIASPTFTGVPAAPTAAPGTNNTQVATTAFTAAAISAAVPATVKTVQLTAAFSGKPAAGAYVVIPVTFAMTIPNQYAGSQGKVLTNPAASAAFNVYLNSTANNIGTATVSTSGAFSFVGAGSGTMAAGNCIIVQAPTTQDTAMSDVGISFAATRS